MFFTTKAEYGVRLLIELGRQPGGKPVSLKAIADAENLPLAYLERIVALLKRANLVQSTRGAHGGYQLSRAAEDIAMNEVVLALEGSVAPMECFVEDDGDGRVLCSHHDEALHRRDGALQREHDLVHRDVLGRAGEPVAAVRAARALDEARALEQRDDPLEVGQRKVLGVGDHLQRDGLSTVLAAKLDEQADAVLGFGREEHRRR